MRISVRTWTQKTPNTRGRTTDMAKARTSHPTEDLRMPRLIIPYALIGVPNNPQGRTIRTMAVTTKMRTSAIFGITRIAKA